MIYIYGYFSIIILMAKDPFVSIDFLRIFCQISSGFYFFEFRSSIFFFFLTEWGCQPRIQQPTLLRFRSF
jgi:hypothetical protein